MIVSTELNNRYNQGNIPIGDRAHEGGLSGTVTTAEAVAVTTLETEGSSVEKDLRTVGERELAVAQVLALLLVLSNVVVLVILRRGLDDPLVDDGVGVGRGRKEREVGDERLPLRDVEVLRV